ncbi:MAG: hypothetical protein MR270_04470 [Erysipelotrichaceae bacterium]|nr:hypothetical protein [Erysipelotrichaceae bacterium]
MLNWLKFTFCSFATNKLAKEGAKRSFWNVIFALFCLWILLTAFFSIGFNYSFNIHYNNASDFKEMSYNLFSNENVNERINLSVNIKDDDTKSIVAYYGYDKTNKVHIDTYNNEADKAKYKDVYNYDVIIDTRDTEKLWVNFEVIMKNTSDPDDVLTYEEYLEVDNKKDYQGTLTPSNEIIDISTFTTEQFTQFEKFITDEFIEDATDTLKETWKNISEMDKNSLEYKNNLYEFYIKVYYNISLCPNLSYYYQYTFTSYDQETGEYNYNNFLLITDVYSIISFTNDKGIVVMYAGLYDSLDDNFSLFDTHSSSLKAIENNVDYLYAILYDSASASRTLNLLINIITYIPKFIIVMAILALFIYCLFKIKKDIPDEKYLGCFKIVSSFLIVTSALSGIIAMILSFITSGVVAVSVGIWSFIGILSIRTFIYAIVEIIKAHKQALKIASNYDEQVIDVDKENEDKVDLSKVDTGTRIIKNDKVSSDDDEKMEFM